MLLGERDWELLYQTIPKDVFEKVRDGLISGADLQTAVVSAGYNWKRFLRIMEDGLVEYNREADGKIIRKAKRAAYLIYIEIQKLVALSHQNALRIIRNADDWKAQKWLLEKQSHIYSPDAFAPQDLEPGADPLTYSGGW